MYFLFATIQNNIAQSKTEQEEENLESCTAAEVVAVLFSLQSKLFAQDCL